MKTNNKTRLTERRISGLKEWPLILILAVVVFVFWLINKHYLSVGNIRGIFVSAFVMGILAVGAACLLMSGKIDLSAGNTGMLAGVLIAILLKSGVHWIPALLITLAFGAVTGLINAFFINGMNFAPFISTLAVSSIYSGVALVVTNSANIPIAAKENPFFISLGSSNIWIFPVPFFILGVLLVVYGVVLSATGFGRRVYMTGGNPNAARLAGINTKKITTILYVNNGAIASLAGILFAALMKMGSPLNVTGSDLDGIAAALLGGVAFTGGKGNMFGVFIGILLITSFQNGLRVAGLGSYYEVVAKGLLLIAALILDYFRENIVIKSLKTGEQVGREHA